MLGLINLYYDNPSANWEIALQEFKNSHLSIPMTTESARLTPGSDYW